MKPTHDYANEALKRCHLLAHHDDQEGDLDAAMALHRFVRSFRDLVAPEADPAEAAHVLGLVEKQLRGEAKTSRDFARAAQETAKLRDKAADLIRDMLTAHLTEHGGQIPTPAGTYFLRRLGRPVLLSTPPVDEVPFELTRPGKPTLDKRAATEWAAARAQAGEPLPEGWAIDLDPKHPMLGV